MLCSQWVAGLGVREGNALAVTPGLFPSSAQGIATFNTDVKRSYSNPGVVPGETGSERAQVRHYSRSVASVPARCPLCPCPVSQHVPGCGVVLSPHPNKLVQVMRPEDGGVPGQVLEIVHDHSHEQVQHLRGGKRGEEKGEGKRMENGEGNGEGKGERRRGKAEKEKGREEKEGREKGEEKGEC